MFEYFIFHPDHSILSIFMKIFGAMIVVLLEYIGWKALMSHIDDPACEKEDEDYIRLVANSIALCSGIPILLLVIWSFG
jgi:hypothetical protein